MSKQEEQLLVRLTLDVELDWRGKVTQNTRDGLTEGQGRQAAGNEA